jgi:LDH2 family malate/lactate/ureidoglycolate dehydrogenase
MLIVDADRALGQLAATKAIEWASEMLSEEPMVGIIIHSTGHLGAIGGLILDVATRGDIAFLAQSNRPVMAPLGAIRPAIGNNPFAFAAPRSGGILLVDLACSAVSFGRIIEVARKHGNIPVDWATDNEGRATTNPEEAMRGALLPAAGHKGIGLAMMIEVLAGILGSAVFGSASSTLDAGGGNAFGFLIRPEKLANVGAFESQIANWASEYERAAGSACHFPGSGSLQRLRQARIAGISYELELMKELTAFGDSVGISLGFEPP